MSLNANLYQHQKEAVEFLANKKKAALLHEQGLGKTVTAIATFELLKDLGKAKSCLIIGQAAYLWQWENAIKRFSDSTYTVITRTSKTRAHYRIDTDYTLVSYHLFRNDFDIISTRRWEVVVCDEAQEFSNNRSKTAKLIKNYNVQQNPKYRWALTGTAIRNKLEDLYSIMYWVDKKFLPPWPKFEKKHIVRDEFTKQITTYKNIGVLNDHLKHRVHRRTHRDVVGTIPDIIGPVTHVIEPTADYMEAQLELLEALDSMKENLVLSDFVFPSTRSKVSKAFSKCKKLLSGENKVTYLVPEISKVLEENEKNRVVVFSFYKEPLYLLDKLLNEAGIKAARFTGDESHQEKQRGIRDFENATRVLLCSNAGARGLDLPRANYVYHIDVPLSFEILDQRNKRVTRLSSIHNAVVINYLITDKSIEKFYFDIILKQGELLKSTFDKGEDAIKIRTQTLRQYLDEYRGQDKKIS